MGEIGWNIRRMFEIFFSLFAFVNKCPEFQLETFVNGELRLSVQDYLLLLLTVLQNIQTVCVSFFFN